MNLQARPPGALILLNSTGGMCLLLGTLVLAGWFFHFPALVRLRPGFNPMAAKATGLPPVYTKSVTRLVAAALACLFSFLLMSPAILSSPDSQLPACCRANGKHKCSMREMNMEPSDDSPDVKTLRARCPYRGSVSLSAAATSRTFLPKTVGAYNTGLIAHASGPEQTEARFRISFSRTRQKRGPPSLSL
jgi:hypothetical protein